MVRKLRFNMADLIKLYCYICGNVNVYDPDRFPEPNCSTCGNKLKVKR